MVTTRAASYGTAVGEPAPSDPRQRRGRGPNNQHEHSVLVGVETGTNATGIGVLNEGAAAAPGEAALTEQADNATGTEWTEEMDTTAEYWLWLGLMGGGRQFSQVVPLLPRLGRVTNGYGRGDDHGF